MPTSTSTTKTPKIKFSTYGRQVEVGSEIRHEARGYKFWTVYKIVGDEAFAKPSKLQSQGCC